MPLLDAEPLVVDLPGRRDRPADLSFQTVEDEVASAIMFMASDLSSGITRQTLDINCGEYHT